MAFEQSILIKETELEAEAKLLKVHFLDAYESLKPINLLKTTFKQAVSSPGIHENIVNSAIGLVTGFVTKKIIVGNTANPFTIIIGKIIELIVANKVVKNADEIKAIGSVLAKKLFSKNGNPSE